ncbi:hypothetical protein [Streptomyces phaeoluteigriseus]
MPWSPVALTAGVPARRSSPMGMRYHGALVEVGHPERVAVHACAVDSEEPP